MYIYICIYIYIYIYIVNTDNKYNVYHFSERLNESKAKLQIEYEVRFLLHTTTPEQYYLYT